MDVSRRSVLRGAGGIAVALPFLELFAPGKARAAETRSPETLITFLTLQGSLREFHIKNRSSPTAFDLGDIFTPLAPHRADLLFVEGMSDPILPEVPRNVHLSAPSVALTCRRPLLDGGEAPYSAGGPSIDQVLAPRLQKDAPWRSVELGARFVETFSWGGIGQPLGTNIQPRVVFDTLFGGEVSGGIEEVRKVHAQKRSVLDAVKESNLALSQKLGCEDRVRLERHLESVRTLERALDATAACSAPARPAELHPGTDETAGRIMDLQILLAAHIIRCRLSNVVTLVFPFLYDFPDIGVSYANRSDVLDAHDALHKTTPLELIVPSYRFYAQKLANLIALLKEPEGDRRMLDRCLGVWCRELARGTHSSKGLSFELFGGGGVLRTGRHVVVPETRASADLHFTVAKAFGADEVTSFGEPEYFGGELVGVLS